MLDNILEGLKRDSENYIEYERLGDYYFSVNINQAFLCYEHALFYCRETDSARDIETKINMCKDNPEFNAVPSSFVILSYNSTTLIKDCIESIRNTCNESSYEIVIIDSSTEEETKQYLRELDDIKIVFNEKFEGFASGCNQGIRLADEKNDLLLLNNDTILLPHALFFMRLGLYSQGDIGAVGPVSNNSIPEQKHSFGYHSKEEWLEIGRKIECPIDRYQVVSWLQGHALMIKRKAYENVGGLDTRYKYGTYEDNDYSLKLNGSGYKTVVCRNAFIYHYGEVSMSKEKVSYLNANLRVINEKWGFEYGRKSVTKFDFVNMISNDEMDELAVLDIGCGLASTQLYVKYRFPNSRVYGIEKDPNIARIARNYTDVLCGDVETMSLPFDDNSLDYIFMSDVVQYLHDPKSVLNRLYKYLKPNGKLIIKTMNAGHISVLMGLVYGELQSRVDTFLDNAAFHRFTVKDLERLIMNTGYKVNSCTYRYDTRYVDYHEDAKDCVKFFAEKMGADSGNYNISEFTICAVK